MTVELNAEPGCSFSISPLDAIFLFALLITKNTTEQR